MKKKGIREDEICFGFNRETDEQSLAAFLTQFADRRLTQVLIPRMNDEEIINIVNQLTCLMRNHLSKREYHRLFLGE